MKNVLVVGGAGYIGSHMVRQLKNSDFKIIVFDNLSTGHRQSLPQGIIFVKGDLRKENDLEKIFARYPIDSVIHFGAKALVQESIEDPLEYYKNNTLGSINLLKVMKKFAVRKLVFSSSGTVYGNTTDRFILEGARVNPINPYGHSKAMIEQVIRDLAASDPKFSYIIFRYFNVAGAHSGGEIGELHEPETHLLPCVLQSVKDRKGRCVIFGDDYPTPDGTCVRDYIHVDDLCHAHVLGLKFLTKGAKRETINLGSGKGFSVKEIIAAVEMVTEKKCSVRVAPRRPGDPQRLVASIKKAKKILKWVPQQSLKEIVSTAWRWETRKKNQ